MSSFLSTAENAARQRRNVLRDFKKMGEESTMAVELALEGHSSFLVKNTILNLNSTKDSVKSQNY